VSTLDGGKSDRPKSKPKVQKNFPPPKTEYTSQALFFKHLVALEVKRFHYARRNKKGLCCEVKLPKLLKLFFLTEFNDARSGIEL
jgi:hypothetical protein